MSLSKAETNKAEKSKEEEKAEKEDDLAASISKSMTVDKLKNALTKNRIVYSTAKKKADFVNLYISNGFIPSLCFIYIIILRIFCYQVYYISNFIKFR